MVDTASLAAPVPSVIDPSCVNVPIGDDDDLDDLDDDTVAKLSAFNGIAKPAPQAAAPTPVRAQAGLPDSPPGLFPANNLFQTAVKAVAVTPSTSSAPTTLPPAEVAKASPKEDNFDESALVKTKPQGLTGEGTASVVVHHNKMTEHLGSCEDWSELPLSEELVSGIFEMGFVKPSKIQEVALPIVITTKANLIGQAQNGSGKTAAFSLGMLARIDVAIKAPQALCLCPTRELSRQNCDVVSKLGKFTGITIQLVVPNAEGLGRKVTAQISVGTPGKIQDYMKRRALEGNQMRQFVLDEADVMLDNNNQMGSQMLQIRKMCAHDCQVLLFSATYSEDVRNFAQRMVPDAVKIEVKKEDLTLTTIHQMYVDCSADPRKKFTVLSDLYGAMNVGQSVIFVNRRTEAFDLAARMRDEGHSVSLITGTNTTGTGEKVDPEYRDRIMSEFRSGVTKVLIATDVLARGIDVPQVTLVINYELPKKFGGNTGGWNKRAGPDPETETYIHRIGRTGRFGLKGISINLCDGEEMLMQRKIEEFYNCKIDRLDEDFELLEKKIKELR